MWIRFCFSLWKAARSGVGSCIHRQRVRTFSGAVFLVVLAIGLRPLEASDDAQDLNIPRRVSAGDPTLQRAVDAYRQARQLDKSLKKSEHDVEAQTKQLEKQLRSTEAEDAVAHDHAFHDEVRMDKELLRQAERETRRDKQLVRQAEGEMRGDKAFLEQAYRKDARSSALCPQKRCSEARDEGSLPDTCSEAVDMDCPRISCYDYQERGGCADGRVCVRPSSATPGCSLPSSSGLSWMRSKCPGMLCGRAKTNGFTPQFCTVPDPAAACPQLDCFEYASLGGCEGPEQQGFAHGTVCAKPAAADVLCPAKAAPSMAAVSPMHDHHASKSKWSKPDNVEDRMVLLILLLLLSVAAGGAFILFKRQRGVFGKPKKPAPVPAYYGRL